MKLSDQSWQALTNPKNIVLVGASGTASPLNFATGLLAANKQLQYGGRIHFVNPKRNEIFGMPCYPDIASIPERPDCVILSLGSTRVPEAARQAIAAGARAIVVHSGGFAERGETGYALEEELTAVCTKAGVSLVGPNCVGMISLSPGAALARLQDNTLRSGSVAIISQSGSVTQRIAHCVARHGVSFMVSTGNEAVTHTEDYLERAILDDATKVITIFVEALREPHRVAELAEKARSAGKFIVALKSGRTAKGGEVTMGHTGAKAGSGQVYAAAFRQAGIALADDFDELEQLVEIFSTVGYVPGSRVALLGVSGGELGHITDLAEEFEVSIPDFRNETLRQLKVDLALPADVGVRNPVDVGTGFAFKGSYQDRLRGVIRTVSHDDNVDVVVIVQDYQLDNTDPSLSMNRHLLEGAVAEVGFGKPIIFMSCQRDEMSAVVVEKAVEARMPLLRGVRPALRSIAKAAEISTFAAPVLKQTEVVTLQSSRPALYPNGMATQVYVFEMLGDAGMETGQFGMVGSLNAAKDLVDSMTGPAVLKVETPRVVHKSDIGGVKLNVTPKSVEAAFKALTNALTPPLDPASQEGVFICSQAEAGVEVFLGAKWDHDFGTVVVVGAGGRLVDLLPKVTTFVAPFDAARIAQALRKGTLGTLLSGYRGGSSANFDVLAKQIEVFAHRAQSFGPDLITLDVNPLIVNSTFPGGQVADARLILTPPKTVAESIARMIEEEDA